MTSRSVRRLVYAALALLLVLHNDVWLWNDARLAWGVPVGLLYHVVFALAVALLMAVLVFRAWPSGLDGEDDTGGGP